MRKFVKILLAILTVAVCFFSSSNVTEARENFDIEKHLVEMDVHEDGTILVTETMSVHFTAQMHGIYVNIPSKYNMTWEINGVTQRKQYKFPVRNIKVLSGHKYEKETFSAGVQIKIGDANKYAQEDETYKFQYEIVTRDLDLDGIQMLFMNIISGNWNTDIKAVEFAIRMPKPFNKENLVFESPEGMSSGSKGNLNVVVNGNTITGTYNATMTPGQRIVVQLLLGENYYKFKDINDYGITGIIFAGICMAVYAVLFFLFGKDDQLVETVEFHAPVGVTSAEVGVIIDGEANDSDVVSLILDWGRRGIINIIDDEKDLILVKKNELEPTARGYEKQMFNNLFNNKESVVVSSLANRFYKTINSTEQALDTFFSKDTHLLFTRSSMLVQILSIMLCFLPVSFAAGLVYYKYEYDLALAIMMGAACGVFMIAAAIVLCRMEVKRYMHKWYTKTLLTILTSVLIIIPSLILIGVFAHCGVQIPFAVAIIIFELVMLVIVMFMRKRTEYGNQVLGQVLGLRNFIIVADADRLQALVDENPYYFYDILPFAYALGLTDIWNNHFRNLTIEPCDWYVCSYHHASPYYSINSLESQMSVIERTLTSAPVESSGGGSIGGGGGGGFSGGGGFGGSGGGGW